MAQWGREVAGTLLQILLIMPKFKKENSNYVK
jgi:hypothetical protein